MFRPRSNNGGKIMDVLKINEERATIDLTFEEIGYLEEACFELLKNPSSEGGTYMEDVGKLLGGFDMMRQLNELAEAKKKSEAKPTAD